MPPTILLVSTHGEIVGGGEISLLGLLKGLDRSRWNPVVVVPSDGRVAAECRVLGLPTHLIPLPTLRHPGAGILRSLRRLVCLARETGVALLHANGSRAMFYAGLTGRLARRPVVWHVRVAERDVVFDRLLGTLARAIIVNSRAVGKRFSSVSSAKVRCIHNGVDLTRFSPRCPPHTLRAALSLPQGVPVVGSIGRFVAFKGYGYLLEAAHLIQQSRPDVCWILVGDGELRAELEAQAHDLGLHERVRFTGWREDVPDILALCDVFVLPSVGEHFGRVLIEAMAMAKPVVATDAGGVPEIVIHGETGLLVPPGQPKALADAALTLLSDPAGAARLGLAGRQRAEEFFSLSRHIEAVEAIYAELLSANEQRL